MAPLPSAASLEADSKAVSRAIILEVLAQHPDTPPRRRTIARRTWVLYEEARARGLRPAAALADAIETVLPYAEQLGERAVCLGPQQ